MGGLAVSNLDRDRDAVNRETATAIRGMIYTSIQYIYIPVPVLV